MRKKRAANELIERFRSLLDEHTCLRSKQPQRLADAFNELSRGLKAARTLWAEAQRQTAEDFNLFEVMNAASDEVRHSKILAWLLDHRIECGTHAQGDLGFRLFLDEIKRELGPEQYRQIALHIEDPDYWVRTEVAGDEARVDIEIAAPGKFLIDIENKIYSGEGTDQTDREWNDLQVRRKELNVAEDACHAFFLTLNGSRPKNQKFHRMRWNRVAAVLDSFAQKAEPPDVKLFASHYAKAIRKLSVTQQDDTETHDGEV